MNDKLVSVIIPSYNNGKYLEYAIESILSQTYKNHEIIIIDDNSSDNTVMVLEKYKPHEKIHIVHRDVTDSIGKARNDGIKMSKGEYIAFIDSDDYWKIDKLRKQIEYLTEYDIVCSNSHVVDSSNCIIKNNYLDKIESGRIKFSNELISNEIITSSVLLKKSIMSNGNWFPEKKDFVAEDYYLWLKLLAEGNSCFYINEELVFYRMLKNKLDLKYNLVHIRFIKACNEYRNLYLGKNFGKEIDTAVNRGFIKGYYAMGFLYYQLEDLNNSFVSFVKIFSFMKYLRLNEIYNILKYLLKISVKRSLDILKI